LNGNVPKCFEIRMLGKALTLVRAERTGRQHLAGLEAERAAVVVEARNEVIVAKHCAFDTEAAQQLLDVTS
jgi:hypothetical protein